MNKQTLFVTLTTAALMCGCQSSKVKISGRFVGGDAKNIYLEQVLPLTQSVVDSAALAPDGSYRMELTGVAKTPSLYNVIYDGERIPLLLAGGDRLTLGSVGSVIRNYTVEGSSESELLRQFYQAFVTGAQQLENMGTEFARKLTDEERKSLIKEYTAEYYRIRPSSCGSSSSTRRRWRRSTPSTSGFRATRTCSTATATWSTTARLPRRCRRATPNRPTCNRCRPRSPAWTPASASRRRSPRRAIRTSN